MNAERALILGNILHRPLRSLITVVAVGVEVCLVVTIVGLTTGLREETAKRVEGVGADLLMQPPAASFVTAFNPAPMPLKIGEKIKELPNVTAVAPVLVQFNPSGFELVYGIDLKSFREVSGGFVYHQGGPFQDVGDILVDDRYARSKDVQAGDTLSLFENNFYVRGVVEHGKGARLFVPIERLQDLSAARDKASLFYIRVDDPKNVAAAEQGIRKDFPRHKLRRMKEFLSMMVNSPVPMLNTFVDSMILLAAVVGFLAIFLSMYTSILERTREIGVLKSLGASKTDIIRLVLWESLLLCGIGIGVGVGFCYGGRFLLMGLFPTVTILITFGWLAKAAVLGIVGGSLGALYPAWLAARQDAIVALAYE